LTTTWKGKTAEAALYARVSCDRQDVDLSISDQLQAVRLELEGLLTERKVQHTRANPGRDERV